MRKKLMCMILASIFCLCGLGMLAGCGEEEYERITLPETKVGETFEIRLEGYGGTPFRWRYEVDPVDGLEYASYEFIPTRPDPDWYGGGTAVYTFKALTIGEYSIKFSAKHVADKDVEPAAIIIYMIKVYE